MAVEKRPIHNVIFLADANTDTETARQLLDVRRIRYQEVAITQASRSYAAPTLLVYGKAFEGVQGIREAIVSDPWF